MYSSFCSTSSLPAACSLSELPLWANSWTSAPGGRRPSSLCWGKASVVPPQICKKTKKIKSRNMFTPHNICYLWLELKQRCATIGIIQTFSEHLFFIFFSFFFFFTFHAIRLMVGLLFTLFRLFYKSRIWYITVYSAGTAKRAMQTHFISVEFTFLQRWVLFVLLASTFSTIYLFIDKSLVMYPFI